MQGRALRQARLRLRCQAPLALASAPVKTPTPPGGGWSPGLVIQGKLHHKVGPLAVNSNNGNPTETPRYAQLYVHDPAAEDDATLDQRYAALLMPKTTSAADASKLKALLRDLQKALIECNGYVQDFLTAGEIFQR